MSTVGRSVLQHDDDETRGGGWRELLAVVLVAAGLTSLVTYPWVFRMGRAARIDSFDGQFSIWNIAWVARTLVAHPGHILDANIFYPYRGTLGFSEMNLGAGVLAIPAYWATRNPYLAHDSAVLVAFALSMTSTYYLARYLTRDRMAAGVAAICFAFCPYVFARTTQVQLQMTFGLPLMMLAFHRMVDRATIGRAVALGAAMACQTYFCAYYGVFGVLMVGFSLLVVATTRQRWRAQRYWWTAAVAFGLALTLVLPLYAPYLLLSQDTGFTRTLNDARRASSDWRSYLASSAVAHRWMLGWIGHWKDVDFPGFAATSFGLAGLWTGWRDRGRRELVVLYGGIAFLSLWASWGPDAGLYWVLYRFVPPFAIMRGPSRFALLVVFGLSVLAAIGLRAALARVTRPVLVGAAVAVVTASELAIPLVFPDVPPTPAVYTVLARQPRAPVIELPFYWRGRFPWHTPYMLASTVHWMPLVNGFSDWIPPSFVDAAPMLATFPSIEAFKELQKDGVRYAVFHLDRYEAPARSKVEASLEDFASYLRPLYVADDTRLYEIIAWPP